MSISALSWHDQRNPRELVRWAVAAAVVLGVHAGALIYLFATHEPEIVGSTVDAITVELAPIDSTPDAVERDVAPAPETMVESQPLPDQPREKPQEEVKAEQPPPDEAPAVVPLPDAKPPEKVEVSPPPAPITAQQVKGGAPRVEQSWQTSLLRQLQRFKRYPATAQSRKEEGVVLLSFSLDRSGHVLAHSITHSSGHADLDNEVMAMIMRAEPLPPFPDSMKQPRIDLTVPIRFSLR
ncbi:MAG: TonB family protein [Xanthobacteraceae bacterium]